MPLFHAPDRGKTSHPGAQYFVTIH